MRSFPSSDDPFARLQAAGCSVGELRLADGTWVVAGGNGENRVEGRGRSQAEAWWRAVRRVV